MYDISTKIINAYIDKFGDMPPIHPFTMSKALIERIEAEALRAIAGERGPLGINEFPSDLHYPPDVLA